MLTKIIPRKGLPYVKYISSLPRTLSTKHSTVDTNEVLKFDEMSREWWEELGAIKTLHSMNLVRVPFIRNSLINSGVTKKELINTPQPLKDIAILDVGCGGGILTEPLARLGSNITGIDLNFQQLQVANRHATLDQSLSNIKYLLESVEEHAIENSAKYDAVVASEVIEHVTEKKIFLEACVKCLKPGGSVFITTENKTIASWLGMIVFAEDIAGLIIPGTHEWNKFISPQDVQRILEEYNCQTRTVQGLFYNFIANTWYLIGDTSIVYALHAVKNV